MRKSNSKGLAGAETRLRRDERFYMQGVRWENECPLTGGVGCITGVFALYVEWRACS